MQHFIEYYREIGNLFNIDEKHLIVGNFCNRLSDSISCQQLNDRIRNLSKNMYTAPKENIFIKYKEYSSDEDYENLLFLDMKGSSRNTKKLEIIKDAVSHCQFLPVPYENNTYFISHGSYRFKTRDQNFNDDNFSKMVKSLFSDPYINTNLDEKVNFESLMKRLNPRYNDSIYVLPCTRDEMIEVSNKLKEIIGDVVFFVLSPYPPFNNSKHTLGEKILLSTISDPELRDEMLNYIENNDFILYRNSVCDIRGVQDISNISSDSMPTTTSLNMYKSKFPDIDPLEILHDIFNSENQPIFIKFNFDARNKDAESNSLRAQKMISRLYEEKNGYLLRNSWYQVNSEKYLKGGLLVIKMDALAKTVKLLKIYGSDTIQFKYYVDMRKIFG